MEINKSSIDRMVAMSDEDLWRAIRLIASTSGIKLENSPAPAGEMAKIRSALSSATDKDVREAFDVLAKYTK